MRALARQVIKVFLLPLLAVLTANAHAGITSVTTLPATKNVPVNRSTSISLTWRVQSDLSGLITITSTGGRFRVNNPIDGPVLGTVSKTLSQSVNSAAAAPVPADLFEAVLVPASVMFQAHKLGFNVVFYERNFSDGAIGSGGGSITLAIGSAGASDFGISRMALQFDDGAPVRILAIKKPLGARAEIEYNGNGLLRGVWELAGPMSTSGQPIFRPLGRVQQQLVAADRYIFKSPPLPTDAVGLYLVRLRITDPEPGFDVPVIRYFVSRDGLKPRSPASIGLTAPSAFAILKPDSRFTWERIKGTRAYQLEFYNKPRPTLESALPALGSDTKAGAQQAPEGPPVTGMLISGKDTQIVLSRLVRLRLKSGDYLWRILAVDEEGHLIGASDYRELRVP